MTSVAPLSDAMLDFPYKPEKKQMEVEEIRRLWEQWRSQARDKELRVREKVDLKEKSESNIDYAKTLTSVEEFEHARTRRALIELVSQFVTEGLSFDDRLEYQADPRSAEAASAFLRRLPVKFSLPKIAPDDGGDVIMVWEAAEKTVLLVMDSWKLHIVIDPATPQSQHLPEMVFDGEVVPKKLLDYLPVR